MSDITAGTAPGALAEPPPGRMIRLAAWAKTPGAQHAASAVMTAIPVIAVNIVAFSGQFAYLRDHLPVPPSLIVLTAIALESIAVYLAYQAHKAQLANDSAARIRLSSYVLALVIGAMNYSHFAADWRPTVAAITFGLMSSISPWLWSVHSRRVSRDKLMEQGLIEEHAVRLGATRWTWHPVGAFRVMRRATWHGTKSPQHAIDDYMEHGPVKIRAPRQDSAPLRPRRPGAPAQPAPVAQEPAPGVARQDVPAIEAPAPAQPEPAPAPAEQVPAPRPAPPGAPVTPPAVHHASAHLAADARAPHGRYVVPPEVEADVVRWLDTLTLAEAEDLPVREIDRRLRPNGEKGDQRRLAGRLKDAVVAAKRQERPAPLRAVSSGQGNLIAPSQQFLPGGVPVG